MLLRTMFLTIAVFAAFISFSQERKRLDYSVVVIDANFETDRKGTFHGDNTFIINYNDNSDILHIDDDNVQTRYIRKGEIKTEYDDEGDKFFLLSAFDGNGEPISIIVYEDIKYGIKIYKSLGDGNIIEFWFMNL